MANLQTILLPSTNFVSDCSQCKVTRLLGMVFESGTPREKGPKRTLIV